MMATHVAAAAKIRQMAALAAALASGQRRAGAGGRSGQAAAGPAGISAMRAARSA